jgi:hypothetical protein
MATCYKTSNNKFMDCPPRMADGRHFTDFRPNCHINNLLRADNEIGNSFQYRLFLSENAETLMDKNREIACSKNCCTPCASSALGVEGFNNGTMLPEKYIQECNEHTCKVVLNNVNGVGTGRRYYTNNVNDCTDMPGAWPKEQNKNICASPLDNFAYLGDLEKEMMPNMLRVAVPGAGDVLSGGDPAHRVNM